MTVWGSVSSNGRLYAGINLSMSPSTVGTGTSSVTINWTGYGKSTYASYESGSGITDWSISGDITGSGSMNGWNVGAGGTFTVASGSKSFSTSYTATNTVNVTFGYTSGGAYPGTHPTVTTSITIPKRPYSAPSAPSGVSATRNSDTQATVNWTRNASSGAPVTSITVQMRTLTGGTWSGWSTVSSPSGSWTTNGAMSYVQTGLSANRKYQFQVRANNTAGSSSFVATGEVYMTPGAPSSVSSSKDPSGTTITTTWVPTAYTSGTVTHQIERSINGGAWTSVVTGIAQGTNTWTDPSPGAGTNQYRVAAKTSTGSLTSAYTTGNSVSTTVAPLAPTLLTPNGSPADLDNVGVILTWQHNHGGDGAAQSHYTIETSINSGATWQALATDVAASQSSRSVAAGALANGFTYLWRVKTEGVVSAGYGPFSTTATIVATAKPAVLLTSPGATTNTLPMTAAWTYSQDQGSPQVEWQAQLVANDGVTILQDLTGSGATASVDFTYPVVDGTTYVIRVRAKSGAGLWGDFASTTTAFSLLPPANSQVNPVYDECTGVMVLELTASAPVGGVTVAVATVDVERRVPGSDDFVKIATGIPVPNTILDTIPATRGVNQYRLTSVSASPSYAVMAPVDALATDGAPGSGLWAFLAFGDGFQHVLRVHGDLKISDSTGRVRDAPAFLGRSKKGLLIGANTSWRVSVGASLHYDALCTVDDPDECRFDSPPSDWRQASWDAEIVCFRDYTGRRLFGMLSDVDVAEAEWPGNATLSFSVEETDFAEIAGTVVP